MLLDEGREGSEPLNTDPEQVEPVPGVNRVQVDGELRRIVDAHLDLQLRPQAHG